MTRLTLVLLSTSLLSVAGLLASPLAQACDWPQSYDPVHQVCAPSAPANCPPQYWQACAYPAPQPYPGPSLDVPGLATPAGGV